MSPSQQMQLKILRAKLNIAERSLRLITHASTLVWAQAEAVETLKILEQKPNKAQKEALG